MYYYFIRRTHVIYQNLIIIIIYVKNGSKIGRKFCELLKRNNKIEAKLINRKLKEGEKKK